MSVTTTTSSPVCLQNFSSKQTQKTQSPLASIAKSQLQATKKQKKHDIDSSRSEKLELNPRHQKIVDKLDNKFNRTFTPFLHDIAAHGIILHQSPLLQSIFYYIKSRLNEAVEVHANFFAENLPLKESFETHQLSIYLECNLLIQDQSDSCINWGVTKLQAALRGFTDLQGKILSSNKSNLKVHRDRLALIKTKSLNQAIESMRFLLFLLESPENQTFLHLRLAELFHVPQSEYDKLLQDIPKIADNLLKQVFIEVYGESLAHYRLDITVLNASIEAKQSKIQKVISNFQKTERPFNLVKIMAFKKSLLDLKQDLIQYSLPGANRQEEKFQRELSLRTVHELISMTSYWEKLYIYKYHSPSTKYYENAIATLENISSSILPRLRQKEELEPFKHECFKVFYSTIDTFINFFTEGMTQKRLSSLLASGKLLVDQTSPKEFFDFLNGIQELSIEFSASWHLLSGSYLEISSIFFNNLIAFDEQNDFEDDKEFETKFLTLMYRLFNDLYSTKVSLKTCESAFLDEFQSIKNEKTEPPKRPHSPKKKKRRRHSPSNTPKSKKENSKAHSSKEMIALVPALVESPPSPSIIANPPPLNEPQTLPPQQPEKTPKPLPSLEEAPVIQPVKNQSSKGKGKVEQSTKKGSISNASKTKKKVLPTIDVSSSKTRKSRNFKKIVIDHGWVFDHATGSHQIFKHPITNATLSVPNHAILKLGIAHAIIKELMEVEAMQS